MPNTLSLPKNEETIVLRVKFFLLIYIFNRRYVPLTHPFIDKKASLIFFCNRLIVERNSIRLTFFRTKDIQTHTKLSLHINKAQQVCQKSVRSQLQNNL